MMERILVLMTLLAASALPVAAQLSFTPATLRMDSLVARRAELDLRVRWHEVDGSAPWCQEFNQRQRETARGRSASAARVAEEAAAGAAALVDGPGGPAHVEDVSSRLLWATPDLAVLRDDVYSYSAGMAHGEASTHFRILAWRRGGLKPASLTDLLDWRRELRQELNRLLRGQLGLLGASAVVDGGFEELDARRLQDAAPVAGGLLYVFNAYEAGSRAEGAFEVLIPWRALAPWLPDDGPLARSLEAAR